jgi:hypothetical protein
MRHPTGTPPFALVIVWVIHPSSAQEDDLSASSAPQIPRYFIVMINLNLGLARQMINQQMRLCGRRSPLPLHRPEWRCQVGPKAHSWRIIAVNEAMA